MAVIVGSLMPWVSVSGHTVSGISGDGRLTLTAAIVGGGVMAYRLGFIGQAPEPRRTFDYIPLLLAVWVALVGVIYFDEHAGVGLYMTLAGGIGWIVGVVWEMADRIPR